MVVIVERLPDTTGDTLLCVSASTVPSAPVYTTILFQAFVTLFQASFMCSFMSAVSMLSKNGQTVKR